MAEDSMLWTTSGTGDGPGGGYTQQNWLDFHRYNFTPDVEGTQFVLPRKGNKLACTAGASSVNVDTGAAWVYGFFYKNTASVNVPITNPTLGTTGLRVVLRASWAAQTVRAAVIRNSDGVIGIPAATQNPGTTYEVTLATGTITNGGTVTLTDARAYLKPAIAPDSSWLDGATIELATGDIIRVKDLGITTAKINNAAVTLAKMAADAVDDTIAGNRVPQLRRRQGGNANDWSVQGTTTQTPGMIRIQCGVKRFTIANGTVLVGGSVTFPEAYSQNPLLLAGFHTYPSSANYPAIVKTGATSTTGGPITVERGGSAGNEDFDVWWIAIGTE